MLMLFYGILNFLTIFLQCFKRILIMFTSTPAFGFLACFISVLFFGSNFVPVKRFETGDGLFFQWVLCIGFWLVGTMVNAIQGYPIFYPLAMVGGALWALGNVCSVPIIKAIGMSLGLLIWGTFNLFSGWITGRFGIFGIHPEIPNDPSLNYAGLALSTLSGIMYIFIKSDVSSVDHNDEATRMYDDTVITDPLMRNAINNPELTEEEHVLTSSDGRHQEMFIESLQQPYKRIFGVVLAILAGLLYGITFIPVIHIMDEVPGSSQFGLDYVYAHTCGALLMSTFCFVVYASFRQNRPRVYHKSILPGLLSGAMLAVAVSGWFVANQILKEPISFPIITTGPGVVASLWGVFVFKEIKGKRNYIILLLAFCIMLAGALLSAFSLV